MPDPSNTSVSATGQDSIDRDRPYVSAQQVIVIAFALVEATVIGWAILSSLPDTVR
jgi:hypothetical protein